MAYRIVRDSQAGKMRALVLDKDIDLQELLDSNGFAIIAGQKYRIFPSSVLSLIGVISTESFEGKTVELCATE